MRFEKILLLLIVFFAIVVRFYKLGEIPAGIHADEESHGYNAFSLIKTGKDRYGQSFPILFRSFGSYQPPIYTYLATIPVSILGNTIFSVRSVSAVAGVFLVIITYFFSLKIFDPKHKYKLALISSLVVAISPWSIFYSRLTAEGSLGVTFFALSMLLFVLSLKKAYLFPVACLVLGISTHSYYSERVISILFLPLFIILYREELLKKNKKWLFVGLVTFLLTMIPHLLIATSGALTWRLVQVGYIGGKSLVGEFIRRYIIYFSPRNLFFDTGMALGRISPEMGVFYTIFIIPFFFGLKYIGKLIPSKYLKLLAMLTVISPIPAALTGDSFYPLRALDLIWIISLVVSIGIFSLVNFELPKKVGMLLLGAVVVYSLFSFYISYFVLFKYERAEDYGYVYIPLLKYLERYKNYRIIIDSARDSGIGLRIAYLEKYDPLKLQNQLRSQMETPYYSGEVNKDEVYKIDNVEVRPLYWGDACKEDTLFVGDPISISESQVKEHNLKFEFDVKDMVGDTALRAYSTTPNREKCSD